MMYNALIKKAMLDSFNAHKEDLDRGGYPYFAHPLHLAEQFNDEETVIVALLHDVVEDHKDNFSWEYIGDKYGKTVVEALKLLVYEPSDNECSNYLDYIRNLAKNPISRAVKLADLRHNMNLERVNGKKPWKYDLYKRAIRILLDRAEDELTPEGIKNLIHKLSTRERNCLIRHLNANNCKYLKATWRELKKIYDGEVKVKGFGTVGYENFQRAYRSVTVLRNPAA